MAICPVFVLFVYHNKLINLAREEGCQEAFVADADVFNYRVKINQTL